MSCWKAGIFPIRPTCRGLAPGLVLLLHLQPVVVPGNGEVHRDLQRLLAVGDLTHLPDWEDEVKVHLGSLVIIEQNGWPVSKLNQISTLDNRGSALNELLNEYLVNMYFRYLVDLLLLIVRSRKTPRKLFRCIFRARFPWRSKTQTTLTQVD